MAVVPVHVLVYNRRRKPWRQFKRYRCSQEKRSRAIRIVLAVLVLSEMAVVLQVRENLLVSIAKSFTETGETIEHKVVTTKVYEERGELRKERGVSIDWKEGVLRFWKVEEQLRKKDAPP